MTQSARDNHWQPKTRQVENRRLFAWEDSRLLICGEFHEFYELFLKFSRAHSKGKFERFNPAKFGNIWIERI